MTNQSKSNSTTPYHIQARQLGADLRAIKRAELTSRSPAGRISHVWDYRAAGLLVGRARELIHRWTRPGYQRPVYVRQPGRILAMQNERELKRAQYREAVQRINALPIQDANSPMDWQHCVRRIGVAGQVIVTARTEDATWTENRHWPTSTSVSYRSYLLRGDWQQIPQTCERLRLRTHGMVPEAAIERTITHDARGNWVERMIAELLDAEAAAAWKTSNPNIRYKSVAVVDGKYLSIYDGETEYRIGQTVRQTAKSNHEGGYYCYDSAEDAEDASVPIISALDDAERAILRCRVIGRCIRYYDGKQAWTSLTPIERVA